jgi:hypothetical protein
MLGAASLICLLAPAAARAGDPTMPLSDVRSGMRCSGLSVVHGTAVTTFDVDVLDVLRGDPEASGPRILIRVSGPAVDAAGIGPGFSGSPIYCPVAGGPARVIGAVSEGLGQYGNHVALATPIEEILGVSPTPPPHARKATALLISATPLATPLTVSGLSTPVRRALLAAARRTDTPLLAAPSGPSVAYPPYPLVPGTSVAAGLSSGDIALAAIGTVTYRDGDKLWAFGHLLDGYGRRSLPLLDAYVFAVIDNPLGTFDAMTYKLAAAGRPVGTLTNDGLGAVAGRIGAAPRTIPLRVVARDEVSGRSRTLNVDVADERDLDLGSGLDMVGMLAVSDAMASVLRSVPPRMTSSVCLRVTVRQRKRPLRFCKRYFDAYAPFDDLSTAFGLIDEYKFGPLDIRQVSVGMKLRAGVSEAFIVRARAPRRVRPGQRIRVGLQLQRSRAGRKRVSFRYRVPRSLRPGRHLLTVRGAGAPGSSNFLEQLFSEIFGGGGDGSGPTRSVPELAARVAALGSPDGVRATFARKGKGPVVYSHRRLLIRGKTQMPVVVRGRKGARADSAPRGD